MSPLALLTLLLVGVLLARGVAELWRRHALRGVRYRLRVAPERVFPGEAVELECMIENAKGLPVPWLLTRDLLPDTLHVPGARLVPHHLPRRQQLQQIWNLWPWQRVRRVYRAQPLVRGLYRLGPTETWLSDLFGWQEQMHELPGEALLIVYPRYFPLARASKLAERPFGERPRSGWLYTDPLQIVGIRPYQAGDPERWVHWPATARAGSLQVKQLAPAVAQSVAIFLEVRTSDKPWLGLDRSRHEAAISVAASLAREAIAADGQLALYSNGALRERARSVRLRAGSGPAQLARVLEALALLGSFPTTSLAAMLREYRLHLEPHVRILVVSPLVDDALQREILLARRSREVELYLIGGAPWALPHVTSHHIPDDPIEAWMEEMPHVPRPAFR